MKYECMFIIKPFLPEDVRMNLVEDIKKIMIKHKAEIEKEDVWGKRHLAYMIKGHEEGYYILYYATIPAKGVEEIKSELRMNSDILRFLILKKD